MKAKILGETYNLEYDTLVVVFYVFISIENVELIYKKRYLTWCLLSFDKTKFLVMYL